MKQQVICRDMEGNEQKVDIKDLSWRPSVYGVVIKDDRILLSPQWDGYDFPGGGMDLGETIEEALVREVKEETGLEVEVGDVLLVANDFFTHPFSKKQLQTILMYFSCNIVGGELSTDGFDENEKEYAKEAQWISVEEIADLTFHNAIDTPALIEQVREKEDNS